MNKIPPITYFLKRYIKKRIKVDSGGFVGGVVSGVLKDIHGDFVEMIKCCPGEDHQIINLNMVKTIELKDGE